MVVFINLNEQKNSKHVFDKAGSYIVFFYNLSGEFLFEINVPNVNLNIYGLYIGKQNEEFTLKTIQHHQAPSSFSNLFVKGIFYDCSQFHFQGLIRIEKKAEKTYAYQKNQNLLLSSSCYVETKPYLEILANDVFCTHGSTTGRLNRDQLLYLATRQLTENQGKFLLVQGFINEIFDKMKKLVSVKLFEKYFFQATALIKLKF